MAALNYALLNSSAAVAIAFSIACLVFVAIMVADLGRSWWHSETAGLTASALVLFHPGNTLALTQVDTISQQTASLILITWLWLGLRRPRFAHAPATLGSTALALLFGKETAFGWGACAATCECRDTPGGARALAYSPTIVVTAAVGAGVTLNLVLRLALDKPVTFDGGFDLSLNLARVARNTILMIGGA